MKFNPAFACCLLDELGVTKLLEATVLGSECMRLFMCQMIYNIGTMPLLRGPPPRTNGGLGCRVAIELHLQVHNTVVANQ